MRSDAVAGIDDTTEDEEEEEEEDVRGGVFA